MSIATSSFKSINYSDAIFRKITIKIDKVQMSQLGGKRLYDADLSAIVTIH